jgi:hypothetical protein
MARFGICSCVKLVLFGLLCAWQGADFASTKTRGKKPGES